MIYPSDVDYSTFPAAGSINFNGQVYVGGQADLDASFTPISGPRAVLEHVARRLISPPGSYDDPDYGFDINTWLNASLLSQELDALTSAVRNEAQAVEGVLSATVEASLDTVTGLVVLVQVQLADQASYNLVFVLGADTIPRVYFPTAI